MDFGYFWSVAERRQRAFVRILAICCLSILYFEVDPKRAFANSNQTLAAPTFSHPGGFYTSAFELQLTTSQAGAAIYYTTDGSEPNVDDLRYDEAITIASRVGEANKLSLIRTTVPKQEWWAPRGEVFKATTIRARVIAQGGEVSPIVTHTYLVDPAGVNRYHLPVVSLVTEQEDFFGDVAGIYVPGAGFDGVDHNTANFSQSGREWERPVHVELFDENGHRVMAVDAGVRIHGGSTRNFQTKSLRLYARDDYGPENFGVQLFADRPFTNYETFILRNGGNDLGFAHLRDGLVHRLVDYLALDVQAFRPTIVLINGEYWGLHDLRERQDANYLQTHYGIPTDMVDMLELPNEVSEGSDAHYRAMLQYLASNGVASDEDYAYLQTQMDVQNFTDYNIVEIFSNNTDWPHNNAENWRYQAATYDPTAPAGWDGRWRWFVKDLDFGFGKSGGAEDVQHNMLLWATSPDGNGEGAWSTFILRTLLENETFRVNFINRFADLLNTTFAPTRVVGMVDEIAASLAPEMAEQSDRYLKPGSVAQWEAEVQIVRDFAEARPDFQRQHIVEFFDLGGTATVELNVSSPYAGRIAINTLVIDGQTIGIESGIEGAAYPWQGIYFQDVPVKLTALPQVGHRFVRWEGLPAAQQADAQQANDPSVEVLLTDAHTVTAHFAPDENATLLYLPKAGR